MTVLVTGNLGYIGSVLTPMLGQRGHQVRGFDSGYFRDCLLSPAVEPPEQIVKDIRDLEREDLDGITAVVHLAGLSNDPLGELDESLTEVINYDGSIRLGELARDAGVRRLVYASSQSMYGRAAVGAELEEDTSEKNPLTAYARTKWEAEQGLLALRSPGFEVTALRPSTVYGSSPRLRCDIVFNNFVACAYTTGAIEIKSDGTPRRPAVHVRDVCEAFIAALEADAAIVDGRAFNVGVADGNYTVRQLATAAQVAVPDSQLVFTGEHGADARTYSVSFERILTELSAHYRPVWDLERGGRELHDLLTEAKFTQSDFRGSRCNRLIRINELLESGRVDESLRLVKS
ncbi:MAG: NAD(P)-dependent oxidoreductase [Acidimicrobiales bacterium]|nr:NAD(P)-dependent oxidoreductase [Acidimicrobiales bacterium]